MPPTEPKLYPMPTSPLARKLVAAGVEPRRARQLSTFVAGVYDIFGNDPMMKNMTFEDQLPMMALVFGSMLDRAGRTNDALLPEDRFNLPVIMDLVHIPGTPDPEQPKSPVNIFNLEGKDVTEEMLRDLFDSEDTGKIGNA